MTLEESSIIQDINIDRNAGIRKIPNRKELFLGIRCSSPLKVFQEFDVRGWNKNFLYPFPFTTFERKIEKSSITPERDEMSFTPSKNVSQVSYSLPLKKDFQGKMMRNPEMSFFHPLHFLECLMLPL